MGLLDRAGARLTSRPEDAEILVVNTCSFIDTAKQESVDTILEMARHKTSGRAKKLIVAGCLVERYRDEIRKNIPEVDAVVGTGELESILEAAGLAPAPAAPSLFTILTSAQAETRTGKESQAGTHKVAAKKHGLVSGPDRGTHPVGGSRAEQTAELIGALAPAGKNSAPKATTANATAAFAATIGRAHRLLYPHTSMTKRLHGFSPRRAHRPTLKLPRAATIHAASASFPTCAANSGRDASSPSPPRRNSSSRTASRRSHSSARTPPATAKTLASRMASPRCSTSSPALRACAGCAFSMPIPTASLAACSRPLRSTTISANTSTCRCSTRRLLFSSA